MAVERYGRLFFLVDSNSRPGLLHLVDLEPSRYWVDNRLVSFPYLCDCESFRIRVDRPCRHVREVADFLVFEMNLAPANEKQARARLQTVLEQLYL